MDTSSTNRFDNFDSSKEMLKNEIDLVTSTSGVHKIRYFALVAYNWPYVENYLQNLLHKTKVPEIKLRAIYSRSELG